MALVPYRVSGPSADQRAAERLVQLPGGVTLRLTQWPALSGAAAPQSSACDSTSGDPTARSTHSLTGDGPAAPAAAAAALDSGTQRGPPLSALANVGLVVWQAGFLLADFLLREAPECAPRRRGLGGGGGGGAADGGALAAAGDWRSLTVVDLGTGSGVVGIALALAGARVFLTDLPHVVPLAAANVAANCDPRVHRTCVCAYRWGDDPAAPPGEEEGPVDGIGAVHAAHMSWSGGTAPAAAAAPSPLAGVQPDIITAADVLYHESLLGPLMWAVERLSAPHTATYVSYRVRHGGEVGAFLSLAEAAGFAAEEVPDASLHAEYRSGGGGGARGPGARRMGLRAGSEAGSDPDDDDDLEGSVSVVERGRPQDRAVGTYGILRLCRRDCASAAAAASAAGPPQ